MPSPYQSLHLSDGEVGSDSAASDVRAAAVVVRFAHLRFSVGAEGKCVMASVWIHGPAVEN